ncbi:helix-turn-helix domain-containing protein [Methylobacterium sp. NEAU 140]|uniref:helix-turn-helix domain-containing protein n=1 Tax=Methylobacterium sp. NEAU 140 TaxID=3064945 RepID=UPI00273277D2|nr:helix-turn-helix domain-containing protein [Methylobacterium sp. NEAU 140]MDP4021047.1 helix-turn-helix domain-containing protein [Methylobacterium sp. NEAU 140]
MTEITPKGYATRSEVAQILSVSAETLREMERKGEGPPVVRFSPRKALYPNVDLVKFLKARTVGGRA